jgi:solute carrier family 25 S-adenosylmethionine transporter 26
MQTGVHSSGISAVKTIINTEGFWGMYTGFRITIFRELPFAFVQFPIYEQLKVTPV